MFKPNAISSYLIKVYDDYKNKLKSQGEENFLSKEITISILDNFNVGGLHEYRDFYVDEFVKFSDYISKDWSNVKLEFLFDVSYVMLDKKNDFGLFLRELNLCEQYDDRYRDSEQNNCTEFLREKEEVPEGSLCDISTGFSRFLQRLDYNNDSSNLFVKVATLSLFGIRDKYEKVSKYEKRLVEFRTTKAYKERETRRKNITKFEKEIIDKSRNRVQVVFKPFLNFAKKSFHGRYWFVSDTTGQTNKLLSILMVDGSLDTIENSYVFAAEIANNDSGFDFLADLLDDFQQQSHSIYAKDIEECSKKL